MTPVPPPIRRASNPLALIWDAAKSRGYTEDGYVVEVVRGEMSGRPMAKMVAPDGSMTCWRVDDAGEVQAWGERTIAADRQRKALQSKAA